MSRPHATRQRLLELIRTNPGRTVSDLRRETGLSRSALRQHLAHLIRAGAVDSALTRRTTGRPPRVYRFHDADRVNLENYNAFLKSLGASMYTRSREEVEASFERLAAQFAAAHPQIRGQAALPVRLEAVRRLFFGPDAGAVERTPEGYQVSLSSCPLACRSMEFGDLCRVTRLVLSALLGQEVVQSEWIIRGDPRCTFEVRAAQPAKSA